MERLTERDWKNKCAGYMWNVHPVKDIDDLPYYKKLAEYEDTGLTPEECMNYKTFKDACICNGVQFKIILTLIDILKGMTCKTCRNHDKCDIEDNFNIKYCSDWESKNGEIY